MKTKLLIVLAMACLGLLSGCSTSGFGCGGCGFYDYGSRCGKYSCTDNCPCSFSCTPCGFACSSCDSCDNGCNC